VISAMIMLALNRVIEDFLYKTVWQFLGSGRFAWLGKWHEPIAITGTLLPNIAVGIVTFAALIWWHTGFR